MDASEVEVTDPKNMISETSRIVNDLEIAVNEKLNLKKMDFDNILICGMGGSAIGGDIVADCLYPISDIPIRVIKFPEMPKWANEKSLAIISSYSGNTAETISIYDLAKEMKCQIICLSSGGQLTEKANSDNNPVIRVKAGIQPRNAVGYSIGYTINAIASVGGPNIKKDVKRAIPRLKKYVNSLIPLNSEAREYAEKIDGNVPIIYTSSTLSSISGRWRAQFNENSKLLAFNGLIPDTNHGELVGILKSDMKLKPIVIVDGEQTKLMKELTNATLTMFREENLKPIAIHINGYSLFERLFKAMILGDFISLHLAFLHKLDPSDITSINVFKELVKKMLGRDKPRSKPKSKTKTDSQSKDKVKIKSKDKPKKTSKK